MDPLRLELIKLRVEILKLKANDYDWCCHVPADVKTQLEETLKEINEKLNEPTKPYEDPRDLND